MKDSPRKTSKVGSRPVLRTTLRLVLIAAVGASTGKMISAGISREREVDRAENDPERIVDRNDEEARRGQADGTAMDGVNDSPGAADRPSSGSRATLSLIRKLPRMGSDEFSGLTKRPAGGWVLQESIVREWAKRFPEEMFMTIHRERLPEDDPRREWAGQAIDQWMEESPSEAIAFLDDMPRGSGGNGDEFHLGAVASAKRRGDYDLAIELEAKWPNGAWVGTDADKFQAWYSAQPQAALAKIASIGDSRLRGNYLKQVGRLSAGRPEEEIVDAISSFSALDREAFVEGVIGEMAQESPVKAIRFHERNFPGMSAAVGPAVIQWAKEAPSEALQWSKENLYGKVFGEVVTIVVRQRGFEDMGSAQELLMEIEPGKVRNQAAAELFNDCVNGKAGSVLEVAEWIVSFPDELTRSYMLEKSWSQLTVRSPDLGMLLCAGDDPAIASERRIGEFAKILHASQRKEFERWLESLPERNRRIAEQAVK